MSESLTLARPVVEQIFAAALAAADPRRAVREAIEIDGAEIRIAGEGYRAAGGVVVVAIGKAAVTMAQGALDALGDRISCGIAITKDGHAEGIELPRIEIHEAAHPIPDSRGVSATQRAIEIVEQAGDDQLILALISGGGSALFEAPQPPVSLADMAGVTNLLLRAGAAIDELNAVRTPLSQVKGGGFLARAGKSRVITLIVSDVLGNDPRVIASGPTVPGNRDAQRARCVLEQFNLWDAAPETVREALREGGQSVETAEVVNPAVIADNRLAVEAAQRAAEQLGLRSLALWNERTGEAREQAVAWVGECQSADAEVDCLIGGGELTVTVTGDGIGGRNTEFVLAAAIELERIGNCEWLVASLATDGQDGPTGVTGGFLDAQSIATLRELGVDPDRSLANNDSLAPLFTADVVVNPGPTGTNVNDLYLAIRLSSLRR